MVKSSFKNPHMNRYVIIPTSNIDILLKILNPYFILLKKAKTKKEIEIISRDILNILNSNTYLSLTKIIKGILYLISSYASINVQCNNIIMYPMVIPTFKKSK